METLDQRLELLFVNVDRFLDALCSKTVLPSENIDDLSYLKEDLAKRIKGYLQEKNVDADDSFNDTLYASLNKEPLKRVEYGIINSKGIPDSVFEVLNPWEAIYFLAGLWNRKSTTSSKKQYHREKLKGQTVELIVMETMIEGLNSLEERHKWQNKIGRYDSEIRLPYAREIRQSYGRIKQKLVEKTPKQDYIFPTNPIHN